MKCGNFDTNATALKQRIQTHERYGANDLNTWIFDHFQLQEGLSVLELGCGTGKQTLPMAKLIGSTGHIVAVDISQEALESVFRSAQELKLENRISVVCKGIDGIGKYVPKPVDRVLSSYSLYYAESPDAVFRDLHRLLNPEGILFFCGLLRTTTTNLNVSTIRWPGPSHPRIVGRVNLWKEQDNVWRVNCLRPWKCSLSTIHCDSIRRMRSMRTGLPITCTMCDWRMNSRPWRSSIFNRSSVLKRSSE